jgi:hypothetical protein
MYRMSPTVSSSYKLTPSPTTAFAGVCRPWTGARGTKTDPVEAVHLLHLFLTLESNSVVGLIHPKVLRVNLTTSESMTSGPMRPEVVADEIRTA